MKTQSALQGYDLPVFLLLACLLSWWSAPFANGGIIPHGPALAAVIVIALSAGRQGLREFCRRCANLRVGWWYLAGPAIVATCLTAAFAVNLLLGATVVRPFPIPSRGTVLTLLLMGGLWEEPGWTGYALPRLQESFSHHPNGTLAATLTMGLFRSIWHLPLVLSGSIAWYDALFFIFAFQIIVSWLYNKTNGSVPAAMVFHYTSNLLTGSVMLLAFAGLEKTAYYIFFVAFACLAALVILWQTHLRYRPHEDAVRQIRQDHE